MRPALRLLPLPLLIAACLPAWAADDDIPPNWGLCPVQDAVPAFADDQASQSVPKLSSSQRTGLPTDIIGDSLSSADGNDTTFDGHVALNRGDQFLGTDRLTYNSDTGKYEAQGSVRYQDSGIRLVAASANGDQNKDVHELNDVRYQLISRRGNGGADRAQMHGALGNLYGSTYSTCPPDDRRWELRARQIDIDTDRGMGVAHGATLRVGKVPVLYVPWFAFPIDDRRRTGLLYPSIGTSGRNGFDWRQPIYINLAPNYDLTLTPRLMTNRGVELGAEFRYLLPHGSGTLDLAFLPSDRLTDRERDEEIADGIPPDNRRAENRGMFRFTASQDLSAHWQARSNLVWLSDPRYLEDSSNSLSGITSTYLRSSIGLYGTGRWWQAGISAERPVLSDYSLDERFLPYGRLPRLYARWEQPFAPHFTAGVSTELVRFQHNAPGVLPGGTRFDLKPYVSMPFGGDSWFATPTLAWRYTSYQLDHDLAASLGGNASPTRSLPIASFDAGMYFDRDTSVGGSRFVQTLEPRLYYLYAPYRDQTDLPQFDTRPLTFGWGQLFRDNRYSGADRQTDANQLTMAVSSRFLRQSDGFEKFAVSVGQIRYFQPSRVLALGETPVDSGQSAWVADASYAINDRWSMNGSYQWDPKYRRQNLASFNARYLAGDDGIVNFGYRYRRNLLKQADVSFLYPLNASWSLVGRYYRSFYRDALTGEEPGLLEGIAGVQWDSCCLAVRVIARRYLRNRTGDMDNALQFEVELKGLGSAGSDTRARLRRAILGYDRDDLYLIPPASISVDNDVSPDSPP